MSQKLKIKFVDFWPGFIPEDSYFFQLMGGYEKVELAKDPEIIFFSNFGSEHKKYKCFRIFFSSENERANMFKCDIALTFDFNKNKRNFRLPLYVLYAHQYRIDLRHFTSSISDGMIDHWKKRKFCCFVVSNGKSKLRTDFFHFLSERERIDSGGRFLNNVGGPVDDKLQFIRNYKFVIAFENSQHNGYTTEKILEPLITNSIPLYWGNNRIEDDFNPNCFLNIKSSDDFELVYSQMKAIELDNNLIRKFLESERVKQSNIFLEDINIHHFIIKSFKNAQRTNSEKFFFRLVANMIDNISVLKYWAIHYTKGHFR